MKIIYLITKSNWGGAQRYVYDLAKTAKEKGFDVVVVFGGNGLLKNKLEEINIKTISLTNLDKDISLSKDISVFFELVKILKNEKPNILHLNSSKIGILGAIVGRLLGIKQIIFTLHGLAFNENRSFLSKLLIKIIYWKTIFLSHKTIAVSNGLLKQISHFPFISKKIIMIRNGIDSINFKDREMARNYLIPNYKNDSLWVGTISELHHIKGLNFAIKAIREISRENKILFIIIGEGEERRHLEELIKFYQLEKIVFLVGNIENAKEYLKAFDIFTQTSLSEGLPYSPLEAGMAGLPIIATNVGGIPEIIENEEDGLLIPSRDYMAIKKAILELISDPEKRLLFGQKIEGKIKNEFSLNEMLKKTFELYK